MHGCDEYKQEQLFPSKSIQVSRITESLCYDYRMGSCLTPGETTGPEEVEEAAAIAEKPIGFIAIKLWAQ